MYTSSSFWKLSSAILFDRNKKSLFLLSMFARNFFQFPGILARTVTRCRAPDPRLSLVPPLIVRSQYWSQNMSTLDDRRKFKLLGRKPCCNMNQKSALGQVYQEVNVSMLHHQLFEFTFLKECLPSQHMDNSLTCLLMPANNPIDHGWKEENEKLLPIWTSLPLASEVFNLDVKCFANVPALRANAWKQSWSASAYVISSWTRTICIDTIQSNVSLHLSICANLF